MDTIFIKKSIEFAMNIFSFFKKSKIEDSAVLPQTDTESNNIDLINNPGIDNSTAGNAVPQKEPSRDSKPKPSKTATAGFKEPDFLIVGLGNPGKEYAETRHNIGWMVAGALCAKHGAHLQKATGNYNSADIVLHGKNVRVIIPTTYMNKSGEAVKKALQGLSLPGDRIAVIVDEYNFPVGRVHLKASGSDGGHNGIASIIEELGSNQFIRLRCGIGNRFGAGGLVDYVLSGFDIEETENLKEMIEKAVLALERLTEVNFSRAMSDVNSGKLFE
jgi:PTH1 family peptidyl-tRNA hydrolase